MPPAVDHEAGGADDVHALVEGGLAGRPAHRQQQVSGQDQQRARPAGDLDEEFERGQAASFRRT
jgi:hypothetical protein